jgi:Bacterial membrane protein YfhO
VKDEAHTEGMAARAAGPRVINPTVTSGEPEREPAPSGRVAWLERGLLAAVALWLFRDVLLFGQVYYVRDIHLVWHAQVEGFVRAIAAGAWPVWNPGLAFGRPLLADPGAQVLYPPTWLNLVLRPWTYYTLFVATHFLIAATGMQALARRYGLSRSASLLAAVGFATSGPVLGILDLWHHFAGACLMPWIVHACDRALAGERRGVARLGLLLALQILAGSADLVAMTLCLSAALGSARYAWGASRSARAAGAALVRVASGAALALGLSAALWMPALEALSGTARTELPDSERTYWSLHPLAALETVLPGLFSALPLNQAWRAELFESREPFIGSIYLGAGMLALVGAAVASSHSLRVALLASLALAGFMALGSHTPVYAVLTTIVPPLQILRYPVKAMTAVAFCWSLLAGLGANAWGRDSGQCRRFLAWTCAPPAIALVAASAAALAAWLQYDTLASLLLDPALGQAGRERLLPQVLSRLLVPAALAAAALALVWAHATRRVGGARVALAVSVLAALDLLVYHRSASPVAPVALYTVQPEVVAVLREAGAKRVYVYDYSTPSTIERTLQTDHAYRLERMPGGWPIQAASALAQQMYLAPESAGRFGLQLAYAIDYRGLYPLALGRLTRLLRDLESTPSHLRLLQLGGVEHVIALHDVAGLVPERTIEGLLDRPIRLMRVPEALPRSYVVGAARAEGDDALAPLLASSFDPRREVVLGGVDRPEPAGFHGTSRILEERADRLLLETEASAPGFAVLLDGFDQGWHARLDGEPAPVLRANAVFRAVAVPRGRHSVEFVYRPRGLIAGLAVSVVSLALVAAIAARGPGGRRHV